MRVFWLTTAALVGFAANSLLCRAALGRGLADAGTFTAVRLVAGAVMLYALARPRLGGGRVGGALALFVYAAAFSFAYVRLTTGAGALILFGAVQLTMLGWGVVRGERPGWRVWLGLLLAAAGLVGLMRPGLTAPDAVGAGLMGLAGAAWGVYSLIGRGTARPLETTARNFVLVAPLGALLMLGSEPRDATAMGLGLAALSGAVTSGLAYAAWYAALPQLSAARAGILQLLVPVLAAVGGVLVLGETATVRLAVAGAAVIGGVAVAVAVNRPRVGSASSPTASSSSRGDA